MTEYGAQQEPLAADAAPTDKARAGAGKSIATSQRGGDRSEVSFTLAPPTANGSTSAHAAGHPFHRKAIRWLGAAIAAALAAMIGLALTGALGQIIDVPRAEDAMRPGDALRITTVSISTSGDGSRSVSFATAPSNLKALVGARADADSFFELALDAGAYAWAPLNVRLLIEGRRNQKVSVVNVRAIDLRRQDPATALTFPLPAQGGATDQMVINLDSSVRVARVVSDAGTAGKPFFDTIQITLGDGDTTTIVIGFEASASAYTFNIAVDYRLGGRLYTQTVTRNGGPFRVTPRPGS